MVEEIKEPVPTTINAVGDVLMTADDASKFLNITTAMIYQLRSSNKIPYKKIGGKLIFSQKELYNWVMSGQSAE